jgi:hypothetical protein
MRHKNKTSTLLLLIGLACILFFGPILTMPPQSVALGYSNIETPTPDPLAVPVMPESPTQVDVGRNLYYYHCMPCHGDQGQGLTDEWREVWPEDHQNCWGRGCHAGRADDAGFPIPRDVPAVSGSPQAIASFQKADDLFTYLLNAHPPQRPGALQQAEYWALTAFLLHQNDRLPSDGHIGPFAGARSRPTVILSVAITSGVLLTAFLVYGRGSKKQGRIGTDTPQRV